MDGEWWIALGVDIIEVERRVHEQGALSVLQRLQPSAAERAARLFGVDDLPDLAEHPSAAATIAAVCDVADRLDWQVLLDVADYTLPDEGFGQLCADGRPTPATVALWVYFTRPSLLRLAVAMSSVPPLTPQVYRLVSGRGEPLVLHTGPIDDALHRFEEAQQPPRSTFCACLASSGSGATGLVLERRGAPLPGGSAPQPSWVLVDVEPGGLVVRVRATEAGPLLPLVEALMSTAFGRPVAYEPERALTEGAALIALLQEAAFNEGPASVVEARYRSRVDPGESDVACRARARSSVGSFVTLTEGAYAFTPLWLQGLSHFDLVGGACLLRCKVRRVAADGYLVSYHPLCDGAARAAAFADLLAATYGVRLHPEDLSPESNGNAAAS